MARHGECVEVSTLKRRVPDLGDIEDPHAFVRFMRQKGYAVRTNPLSLPKGKGEEVSVPARELSLVFVTAEVCGTPPTR